MNSSMFQLRKSANLSRLLLRLFQYEHDELVRRTCLDTLYLLRDHAIRLYKSQLCEMKNKVLPRKTPCSDDLDIVRGVRDIDVCLGTIGRLAEIAETALRHIRGGIPADDEVHHNSHAIALLKRIDRLRKSASTGSLLIKNPDIPFRIFSLKFSRVRIDQLTEIDISLEHIYESLWEIYHVLIPAMANKSCSSFVMRDIVGSIVELLIHISGHVDIASDAITELIGALAYGSRPVKHKTRTKSEESTDPSSINT